MVERASDAGLLEAIAGIVRGSLGADARGTDVEGLCRIARVGAELVGARQAATAVWTAPLPPAGRRPPERSDGSPLVGVYIAGRTLSPEEATRSDVALLAMGAGPGQRSGEAALARSAADHELDTAWPPRRGPLSIPLRIDDGREIGRIVLADPAEGGFSEADERILQAYADITGAALGRQQLVMRLEEAQGQREAFFGVVSHELRTPITTIYGGTHVLRRSFERLSHDARVQLFEDIADEAERLYRLVEDLLVLSRAEREALVVEAEPILLQHVLPRIVGSERERWPRGRLRVDVASGLPPAMGDMTLVEQIVRNLLSNALKYASHAGPIDVTARSADGWVEVRVADLGPGVNDEAQEQVFELFFRSPESSSKVPGAGIGLYACRELVRSMGGEIWVRSREPSGAEFGFRLPEYTAEDLDIAPEKEPTADQPPGVEGRPAEQAPSVTSVAVDPG